MPDEIDDSGVGIKFGDPPRRLGVNRHVRIAGREVAGDLARADIPIHLGIPVPPLLPILGEEARLLDCRDRDSGMLGEIAVNARRAAAGGADYEERNVGTKHLGLRYG